MPSLPSRAALDKSLAAIAVLASKSAKLSPAEKKELRALATKAGKPGKQGLTMPDRARCGWLIKKAGPEKLPAIPEPVKKLLGLSGNGSAEGTAQPQLSAPTAADPLDRLEKLGALRGGILSEPQFESQRAIILADPAIAAYGAGDGVDPYDRLIRVGELQTADLLTDEQASSLTASILNGA